MTTAPTSSKLRGGYYTPRAVAEWLTRWAIRSANDRVLEPSCGDGVFLASAADALRELGAPPDRRLLLGVEILARETARSKARLGEAPFATVQTADFFEWVQRSGSLRFDCVIGNPPFIRYQNFPEPSRSVAMGLMKGLGLRPNKLTNIWVPFVAVSTSLLDTGGRLAMVVPAELLQVSYAAQLRSFLVDRFRRIKLVACNEMIFPDAEQEVVLLLADGKIARPSAANDCRIDLEEYASVQELLQSTPGVGGNGRAKVVRHDSEKWLKYFLSRREIAFMRELREGAAADCLASYAAVDIGVVTGNNSFFVLSPTQAEMRSLGEHTMPLLGRSAQLRGAVVDEREMARLEADDARVLLFCVPEDGAGELPAAARAYITYGEQQGVNRAFKCRVRRKWYSVPSVWVPDCFLFRQIYDFPRSVVNRAHATSTDTIHRVRCRGDADLLVRSLYTHLTAASAEIEGRSYGGGVLELEPTEAERLLLPKGLSEDALGMEEVDDLVRAGRLGEVLEENAKRVLVRQMGLSRQNCIMLEEIWNKMRDRRMSRRRAKPLEHPLTHAGA